jgi:hypothetical protein
MKVPEEAIERTGPAPNGLTGMSVPQNPEAAFIAEITAGATHEMRNVLAIVKESAGLIDDLVRAFDQRGSLDQEKLQRAVGRIDAQVTRGAELLSHLNRFTHSLDHASDTLDLEQEVRQVAFLCQRRAKRRRQQLQVQPGDQNPVAVTNPFPLQQAMFTAVDCCMQQLPEGSTIAIGTGRTDGRPSVEFTGDAGNESPPSPTEAEKWDRLAELLDDLGASLETTSAAYGFRVVFPVGDTT